jgi:hypothetical protein
MSSVVIAGNTSGTITLDAPNVAGTTTLTLPTTTDTLVGRTTTDTLTNKTLTSPVISGTPTGVGVLTSGTSVASTSGTSIDFTSIPSWVKRITVMFYGVSTNGSSTKLIQIGSGSIDATGYAAASSSIQTTVGTSGFTTGFGISSGGAAELLSGNISLTLITTNQWIISGVLSYGSAPLCWVMAGGKTLSGTLDRIRITTVNGTDAFDAGSINILYE